MMWLYGTAAELNEKNLATEVAATRDRVVLLRDGLQAL